MLQIPIHSPTGRLSILIGIPTLGMGQYRLNKREREGKKRGTGQERGGSNAVGKRKKPCCREEQRVSS